MISDSYPIKEVDKIVFEVDCAMINVDYDGNDHTYNEGVLVNNIIYSFGLQPMLFDDKKSFANSFKSYLKNVKGRLQETGKDPDYIADFEKRAKDFFAKRIFANFNDWEFFTGESMDVNGMIVIKGFRELSTTPYMMFWKHGFEEKIV
ncbi:hypothetical protein FPSE5266_00691 [Fusarium pseudograminearum]|nr:hypothetical protein FPSE5266_00691 [Fusarium pseudograminearum]